jgi:hypothetical protein
VDTNRRKASLLATLMAGVLLLATAVPALAGDTRSVFVGSPNADGSPGVDGSLTFTKVSTGGATKTNLLISNDSNATMNKTTLSIGTFPAPTLPEGVTIKAIFGADATATNCPIAADARSAICSFNNLASGKQKNVSILFGIATAGDKAIELAVKVKETVNDNGANKDTFVAKATAAVDGASCDSVATYTAPNTADSVSTEAEGCVPQSTKLDIPGLTNGAEVQVGEEADSSCATGLTCFGIASTATVNNGGAVKLVWTITWSSATLPNNFNLKKLVIIHTNGAQVDKIANTNQNQCGNSATKTNCIVSAGFVGTNLVVSFRTPNNGKIKGAF